MGNTRNRLFSKILIILAAVSVGYALLFSLVVSPLIAYAANDATIPYLPDVLDVLLWILDLLVFFFAFGVTEYCVFRFGMKKAWFVIAIYEMSVILKYAFNILAQFFVYDAIPGSMLDVTDAVTTVATNAAAETLQYFIIIFITFLVFRKPLRRAAEAKRNAEKLGIAYDFRDTVFPINKLVNMKNPAQASAFFAALTVTAFKVFARMIYDIAYGLPTSAADFLWMVIYYLSDVVFGVLGYLIMIFVLTRLDASDQKASH